MYEYKVLTERDARFTGKFDFDTLESTLNAYAVEGWRLAESFLANNVAKSVSGNIVAILEREIPQPR